MFYKDEKIALFIDGMNIHSSARAIELEIDFKQLRDEFMKRGRMVRASYYTATMESEDYSPLRPLLDWLDYNSFTLVTKPAREFVDTTGRRKVKGNMVPEMTVDMLELSGHVDHVVLFSGDGDFRCVVEALQRRGVRVTVISTIKSNPPMIADDLRRRADTFVDLDSLRDLIGRTRRHEDGDRSEKTE